VLWVGTVVVGVGVGVAEDGCCVRFVLEEEDALVVVMVVVVVLVLVFVVPTSGFQKDLVCLFCVVWGPRLLICTIRGRRVEEFDAGFWEDNDTVAVVVDGGWVVQMASSTNDAIHGVSGSLK
jgi:hypothetical protein